MSRRSFVVSDQVVDVGGHGRVQELAVVLVAAGRRFTDRFDKGRDSP